MKKLFLNVALFMGCLTVNAGQLSVSIQPMSDSGTFSLTTDDLSLQVLVESGTNESETAYLILEGLAAVDDSTPTWRSSTYYGTNSEGSLTTENGVVLLQMPADTSSTGAVSPIVGIVPKTGAWSGYSIAELSGTTIGGNSGNGTYDGSTLSVSAGNPAVTGQISYTVQDDSTLLFDAFSLTKSGVTYSFGEAVLLREGANFTGVLMSADATLNYASLYFKITLSGIDDVDLDAIPDISDQSLSQSYWSAVTQIEGWRKTSLAVPGERGIGWIYDAYWPYIWSYDFGSSWLYILPEAGSLYGFYGWHYALNSWIWANNTWGWYYVYSTDQWLKM
jgi:hypothetical protein